MLIAILLFENFETLDVFGPVEVFGKIRELFSIQFYALNAGIIKNNDNVNIETLSIHEIPEHIDILLIPGGIGTRTEIHNKSLIDYIRQISNRSRFVLCVCTGAALLAKTGLLDNKSATSNKRAMSWVMENNKEVNWNTSARWIVDGKFYTSSGISAGIDMTLGFIRDQYNEQLARQIAKEMEYFWNENSRNEYFKFI